MAVVSVVKLSELEGAKRIDAEYYQPEYLKLESFIKQTKSYKLWGNIEGHFITGPFGSEFKVENYVTDSPYRYVRGRDVKEFFLLDDENVYIPKKDFERLKKYSLQEGYILISVVGTLGNTAIVDKDVPPAIFSCKSTAYIAEGINPFYLIAYLNCRYGKDLLKRRVRGAVQTGLNIDDLKYLPIYLPDKKVQGKVAQLVNESKLFYDKSKSLYTQAENLLLEDLGLKDFKPKYELFYTANLSQAFGVHRVDAEYFQPMYEEIEEHLTKNFETLPIKKIRYIDVTTGQYTENYVSKEEGKPYIRGTDISNGTINTDSLLYISPEDQIESKKAKEGDVVVTRVGTIGLSARIPKECEGGTISDNLIRIRIFDEGKLNSYYLALYLGSSIGVSLMIKNSRGSVQQRLNQETLKEVIIPLLPSETQQKIAELVKQSHKTRRGAKELLEEAKEKLKRQ